MADVAGTTFGGGDMFASSSAMTAEVTSADIWAQDLCEVRFSESMALTSALGDTASYTIEGDDGSTPTIIGVFASPRDASVATGVWLHTTALTIGVTYTVTVVGDLSTSTGGRLKPTATTAQFIGRRTSVDALIASLPRAYNTTPGSNIRHLLNAMGRQLDLTGGSRYDCLP